MLYIPFGFARATSREESKSPPPFGRSGLLIMSDSKPKEFLPGDIRATPGPPQSILLTRLINRSLGQMTAASEANPKALVEARRVKRQKMIEGEPETQIPQPTDASVGPCTPPSGVDMAMEDPSLSWEQKGEIAYEEMLKAQQAWIVSAKRFFEVIMRSRGEASGFE